VAEKNPYSNRFCSCFLVTYFFMQKIVGCVDNGEATDEGIFVDKYGAYLQMHACLSFAASRKDEVSIVHLLKAAKYDPLHTDVMREIQKSKNLVFYDSVSFIDQLSFCILHLMMGSSRTLFFSCRTSCQRSSNCCKLSGTRASQKGDL
jgi:hypothetical protein